MSKKICEKDLAFFVAKTVEYNTNYSIKPAMLFHNKQFLNLFQCFQVSWSYQGFSEISLPLTVNEKLYKVSNCQNHHLFKLPMVICKVFYESAIKFRNV